MRVFIYIRVSSEGQDNIQAGHTSLDAQEAECLRYCTEQGYQVEAIFGDVSSARNMDNMPYLMRMVRELETGDLVVFYNITRFSRNTRQGLNLLHKLMQKGINVYSVAERCGYRTTAEKHLFRTTLSVAESESDMISDRVRTSIAYRRAQGAAIGNAPYGMQAYRDPNGIRKFRPVAAEQAIIQYIIDKYENDDKSSHQIAKLLNQSGRRKRGRTWTSAAVYYILYNRTRLKVRDMRNAIEEIEAEDGYDDDDDDDNNDSPSKRSRPSTQQTSSSSSSSSRTGVRTRSSGY